MCKYSHITLLEYEGKKHVAPGETGVDDETLGATKYWYTQRCRCRPLETRDTSLPLFTFNISLLFITVQRMYFLRNIACAAALLFHRQEKNIHIQTCTHVYQLVYLLYFINLTYWRLRGPPSGPPLFYAQIFHGSVTF